MVNIKGPGIGSKVYDKQHDAFGEIIGIAVYKYDATQYLISFDSDVLPNPTELWVSDCRIQSVLKVSDTVETPAGLIASVIELIPNDINEIGMETIVKIGLEGGAKAEFKMNELKLV